MPHSYAAMSVDRTGFEPQLERISSAEAAPRAACGDIYGRILATCSACRSRLDVVPI
jgi:hypothetical protein